MIAYLVMKVTGPASMVESVWDSKVKADEAIAEYSHNVPNDRNLYFIITRQLNTLYKIK
jgi:hypothetical protein